MHLFVAFIAGSLFSLGLILSGMTDTAKVRGFLDVLGAWNPTLMFVMLGALIPMTIGWRVATKMATSVCDRDFPPKPVTLIDRRLLLGAVLFGVGWGLAGFCPGPALSSLGFGGYSSFVFVIAMLFAMAAYEVINRHLSRNP